MKPRAGRRVVDGGLARSVSSEDGSARHTSYKKDFATQEGPSWNRQFTANSPHIWIVRAPCGFSGRREIPSELFEVV